MKRYQIANTDLEVSRIGYGCMRLASWNQQAPLTEQEKQAAIEVVLSAVDSGITLFDHADIYAYGKAEEAFAAVWQKRPDLREHIILQSKCGIILPNDARIGGPGRYDFSYEHIMSSVAGTLRRLDTDYLDILLLHRPDPLMEPEEVARAFDALHGSGQVRAFGVSNHNVGQMELLRRYVNQPLVINQLELNLLHNHLINEGIIANREEGPHALATGILDYCRLHNITIQAYSPVANGNLFAPPPDAGQHVHDVAHLITLMAERKQTSPESIVLAWLLHHPAGIQPIIGTMKPERVRASALADDVELTREEWYTLFTTARGASVP